MTAAPVGYGHPRYAESLADARDVLRLPRSGGSLLVRAIAGTGLHDAAGPYPLFACEDPRAVAADLAALHGIVSVVVVPDPLGGFDEALLRAAFPDLCAPYKTHFVADLSLPERERIDAHHRKELKRPRPGLEVERIADPAAWIDEWTALYSGLVERLGVRGPAAFTRTSFDRQFTVPGLSAWRARLGGETVAAALWYAGDSRASYHLAASNDAGYRCGAAYPLMRRALADLAAEGVTLAGLGGAAGLADDPSDGLAKFKRGWSTSTQTAFLCGRIVDREAYEQLSAECGDATGPFFPAYRRPVAERHGAVR
ncbi:MAG: GNAT family N-acetyltransferase [Planctomycetes bacterium]|nr:GNAT family N-acetyltransferase [Planctomycetota bacterium]